MEALTSQRAARQAVGPTVPAVVQSNVHHWVTSSPMQHESLYDSPTLDEIIQFYWQTGRPQHAGISDDGEVSLLPVLIPSWTLKDI
mmetsp:Transcript_6379/g.18932  ORF Transcript_6379/g.18932 Transcript_6379/m.18932 type:complete len:86 (+) Transcript_6379:155-412(+)